MKLMTSKKFGRESGVTLIEIMIATGLVSLISIAIATIVSTGTKGQKAIQSSDDSRTLTNEIASVLSDPAACLNTFNLQNPTTPATGNTSVTVIKDRLNAAKYTTTTAYGNKTVVLDSFVLGGDSSQDPRTKLTRFDAASGTALLLVRWSRVGALNPTNVDGPAILTRYILINTTLNGSSQIIACRAQTGGSTAAGTGTPTYFPLWQTSTTLIDSVVNQNAGNVIIGSGNLGIGISAPTAAIHVNKASPYLFLNNSNVANKRAGIAFLSGVAQYEMGTDAAATGGHDFYIYDSVSSQMRFNISGAGNVGISASSPGARLHVVGDGTAAPLILDSAAGAYTGTVSSSNTSYGLLNFNNTSLGSLAAGSQWAIGNSGSAAALATAGSFLIHQHGVGPRMTLTPSGFVGLGTTTPGYKLHVANPGGGATWVSLFTASDNTANVYFAHPTIGVYSITTTAAQNSGIFHNSTAGVYCYLGTGSGYSISCNGPTSGVSDGRLKKNIRTLGEKDGLAAVLALNPVRFNWKDEKKNKKGRDQFGFIAQEVEKVVPDLVGSLEQTKETKEPEITGPVKVLNYEGIIPLIVKAVQKLMSLIDGLLHEMENLRKENAAIKSYLCAKDPEAVFCRK